MKIGYANDPRRDLIKELEWIGKNGFDFVDLFLEEDKASADVAEANIDKIKAVLKKYDLGAVGHTAFYLPYGSPIKQIRDAAIAETIKYFKIFSKLGVKYVTVHADWPPSVFTEKEGLLFQTGSLRRLVNEAKKFGIILMYEPKGGPQNSIENIEEVMKLVPELYLHLDIGHSSLFSRKPEEFIKRFHRKIRHVHLHDNDCKTDLHLPIGAGSIDWPAVISALKKYYDGTITLEIFSKDRDYVLLSKKKVEQMLR